MHNSNIYKDTMSNSSVYSNPYDLRNHNNPTLRRKLVDLPKGDALETQQQRLERQAIEKFRLNNFTITSEKILIVAKVGKYLFLAIMLPPYLLFYGLPKWLLMDAFPSVLTSLNKQLEPLRQAMRKMLRAYETMLETLSHQQKRANLLLSAIQSRISKMMSPFKQAVEKFATWSERAALAYRNLAEKFYAVKEEIRKTLIYFPDKVRDRVLEWSKRVDQKFTGLSDLIAAKVGPFDKWASEKTDAFFNRIHEATERLKDSLKRIGERLLSPVKRAYDALEEAIKKSQERFKEAMKPYLDKVAEKLEPVKDFFNRAQDAISQKYEALQNKLQDVSQVVNQGVQSAQDQIANMALSLSQVMVNWLPASGFNFVNNALHGFKRGGKSFKQMFLALKAKMEYVTDFLKNVIFGIFDFLRTLLDWCQKMVAKAARILVGLSSKLMKGLFLFLKGFIYWLAIVFALFCVLIKLGFRLVRSYA